MIWFLILILLLLFCPTSFALDAFDQAQIYLESGDIDRAIQILKPLTNSSNEDELSQVVEVLYTLSVKRPKPGRDSCSPILSKNSPNSISLFVSILDSQNRRR